MGFDPASFKRSYSPGDLFYGLAGPRGELMTQLGAPSDRTQGAMINFYNVGDYAKSTPAPADNSAFTDYLRSSSNPKHTDLMSRFDAMKNPAGNWPLWKRKSKSGLWWALRSAGKTVHFCLYGLDMDQVVNKCFPGVDGGKGRDFPVGPARKQITDFTKKETSITGAELRWMYRNRADDAVKNLVQFWNRASSSAPFDVCVPPWVTNSALWGNYTPNSEFKGTPNVGWKPGEGV